MKGKIMSKIYLAIMFMLMPVMAFAQEATNTISVDVSTLPPGWIAWIKSALAMIATVMGAAAALAAALPKSTDDSATWYKVVRGIIDFIAANWGNAKNAK